MDQTCKDECESNQPGGAKLLRTCQKLYWEGFNVLHHDQCIELMVGCGSICNIAYSMLDTVIEIADIENPDPDILSYVHESSIRDCRLAISPSRLASLLSTFTRITKDFQHITLFIDPLDAYGYAYTPGQAFLTCRALQPLLEGKDVHLRPAWVVETEEKAQHWLPHVQALGARSISDPQKFIVTDQVDLLQGISSTLSGDAYELWWNFKEDFIDNLQQSTTSFELRYWQTIRLLVEAIVDYDFEAFQLNRKALMNAAIDWNKKERDRKVRELQEQINAFSTAYDKANDEIQAQIDNGHEKPYFDGVQVDVDEGT